MNLNLSLMKDVATRAVGSGRFIAMKHSPEILLVVGVVGVVASTVLACRATLKAKDILEESDEDIKSIHEVRETSPEKKYSKEDYQKDLVIAYTQRTVNLVKLYAPAVGVGVIAVGCLVGSHNILSSRNMALMAAYKVIDESYKSYRQHVIEEYGEEKDFMFRNNMKNETRTVLSTDENGKIVKTKKTVKVPAGVPSDYARYFNESNIEWRNNPQYNLTFLTARQNQANERLNSVGFIFLNEVYDMLHIPRTPEGQIVGWLREGPGERFVDFGLNSEYNLSNVRGGPNAEWNPPVLLEFNVQGNIWDKIGSN